MGLQVAGLWVTTSSAWPELELIVALRISRARTKGLE